MSFPTYEAAVAEMDRVVPLLHAAFAGVVLPHGAALVTKVALSPEAETGGWLVLPRVGWRATFGGVSFGNFVTMTDVPDGGARALTVGMLAADVERTRETGAVQRMPA